MADRPANPRVLVLRHARAGSPGLIGEAMAARAILAETRFPHEGDPLPASPAGYAGLLMMGGLMSAWEDGAHPHFPALLDLIRDFADSDKPVLGVCLGAQLIARAWGGRIRRHRVPEFGYVSLELTEEGRADPLLAGLPPEPVFMQWHGDSFDLPDGAVRLLSGAVCANQAMRLGAKVYAFQCHFEVTQRMVADWAAYQARLTGVEADALGQSMARQYACHGAAAARAGRRIAARWLDLVS